MAETKEHNFGRSKYDLLGRGALELNKVTDGGMECIKESVTHIQGFVQKFARYRNN